HGPVRCFGPCPGYRLLGAFVDRQGHWRKSFANDADGRHNRMELVAGTRFSLRRRLRIRRASSWPFKVGTCLKWCSCSTKPICSCLSSRCLYSTFLASPCRCFRWLCSARGDAATECLRATLRSV